jgi:hypothetical protein
MKYLTGLLLLATSVALQAQSNGTVLGAASANTAGLNGQSRGIRFVTRRTSMAVPGAEARTFFTAGGVNLGAGIAPTTTTIAPAAVVAETWSPELQRPEVQAALRQLAAAGDLEARRLLAHPKAPAITTATRSVR